MALERVDYLEAAVDVLAQQYRGRDNWRSLLEVFARQFQEVEDAAQEVLTERLLDKAVGEQISVLERIVGQSIFLTADETVRKAWIASRIRLNRSSGTGDDLLDIFTLVLPAPLVAELTERFPAALHIRVAGGALPLNLVEPLARILKLGKAAGVGSQMLWQPAEDADTFRFADPNHNSVATAVNSTTASSTDTMHLRGVYGWTLASVAYVTVDPDNLNGHKETAEVFEIDTDATGVYVIPVNWANDHDVGELVVVTDSLGNPLTTENAGKGFADLSVPGSGGQFASVEG